MDTYFYTTEISVYKDKAEKYINRFRSRCQVPIIERNSETVQKLKYIISVNSVLKAHKNPPLNVAVFDKNGELTFLLATLLQKCRTVYIYTEKTEEYSEKNDEVFKSTGAAAVITDYDFSVNRADFIVSSVKLPINNNIPIISRYSLFANDCVGFPHLDIPQNTDVFCVLAGLNFICKKILTNNCYSENIVQKLLLFQPRP